jgi:hypothetical protein
MLILCLSTDAYLTAVSTCPWAGQEEEGPPRAKESGWRRIENGGKQEVIQVGHHQIRPESTLSCTENSYL